VITVNVATQHTISDETINDLLIDCAAGSEMWAYITLDEEGDDMLFRSKEEPDLGVFRVNEQTIINGIMSLDSKSQLLRRICTDSWDAVDADMIVQRALFGEVVYG
jgi:hypothetical protein